MAVTQIVFGVAGGDAPNGGVVPNLRMTDIEAESLVPSGTSQATSIVADSYGPRPTARIATDTAVYVSFGSAPNAGTDPKRILVPAGWVTEVFVAPGDKAAVITA